MDDDEEVVLPGSPLSEYLKEIDCVRNNSEYLLEHETEKRTEKLPTVQTKERKTCNLFSLPCFSYLKNCFLLFALQDSIALGECLYRRTFTQMQVVDLLTPPDEEFSKHLRPRDPSFWQKHRKCAIFLALKCSSPLLAFYLLFDPQSMKQESLLVDFLGIACLLLSGFALIACIVFVVNWLLLVDLKGCVDQVKDLSRNLQKSLRLVQETEIIAHGFTTATKTGIAEHLECSSSLASQHYIELRKNIFVWMRDLFLTFRLCTLDLSTCSNKDIELHFSTQSLSRLVIDEFGELLKYDPLSEGDKLGDVSDNFSISSLKTMSRLMKIQVSEFFLYLHLLYPTVQSTVDNHYLSYSCLFRNFLCIHQALRGLKSKTSPLKVTVRKTYDFYRVLEVTEVDKREKIQKVSSEPEKFQLNSAVHSITLHLKSSLLRLIEVEDFLNSDAFSKEDSSIIDSIRTLIHSVEHEVSTCRDEFAQCDRLLDGFLKRPADDLMQKEVQKVASKTETVIADHKSPIQCNVEREITDEVFEDIIPLTLPDMETEEEKVYLQKEVKKNKDMTSHLMSELKNILTVKADECRAREKMALAKQTTKSSKPLDSYSTSNGIATTALKKDNISQSQNLASPEHRGIFDEISETVPAKSNNCDEKPFSESMHYTDIKSQQHFPSNPDGTKLKKADSKYDGQEMENLELKRDWQFIGDVSADKDIFREPNDSHLVAGESSFAASIAMMAAKRQGVMGSCIEEFILGDSDDDSDSKDN